MYKRDLCICKPFQYIIFFKFTESYIVTLFWCCCCCCSFVLLIFPHNDLLFPISLLILIFFVLVLIFLYYMRSLFFYLHMFSVFFHTSSIQIEKFWHKHIVMQHLQPYENLTDECLHSLCLSLSWEQMTQWLTFNRNGIHSKPTSFVSVRYIILEYN